MSQPTPPPVTAVITLEGAYGTGPVGCRGIKIPHDFLWSPRHGIHILDGKEFPLGTGDEVAAFNAALREFACEHRHFWPVARIIPPPHGHRLAVVQPAPAPDQPADTPTEAPPPDDLVKPPMRYLSPAARKAAVEAGLTEDEIASIAGTGTGGGVNVQDVRAFIESRAATAGFGHVPPTSRNLTTAELLRPVAP